MPEIFLSDRQVAERYGVHHLTPRRWVREDLDLSRICAAPSARLGHVAFEGQGAFASQC